MKQRALPLLAAVLLTGGIISAGLSFVVLYRPAPTPGLQLFIDHLPVAQQTSPIVPTIWLVAGIVAASAGVILLSVSVARLRREVAGLV